MSGNAKIQTVRRIKAVILVLILCILSVIMLMPLFIMVTTGLKNIGEIFAYPPSIIPKQPVFSNYYTMFEKLNFFLYFKNSLTVSMLVLLGTILSSSVVAFGFSRYRAPGKKFLFMLLLATMMIPYPTVMIPQFILFNNLNWINSFKPLVVPSFFGSAYMIFMLRQFFGSLNNALFDAARIDGCSEFRCFWNIAMPLSKPAVATVAIFSFVWNWDDLLSPVIYLNNTDKYTLPVMLAGLTTKFYIPQWNTMMVAALFTAMPSILLFVFCQKYFIEGIVTTGMKD